MVLFITSAFHSVVLSAYDISKEKILYTVGYAHLDTQWRWDYTTTINTFLLATLDDNFELFEKYPDYVFNFTGARRYAMMKEYYPDRYQKLKEYIKQKRWFISGSSVDEGEINVTSAESDIRQVLYGNDYFRKEFGVESVDYILPDCFGFQACMPSIWAHCGLLGFSTQKLTWGSAVGIPFNIGVWKGVDGKGIICALNPDGYTSKVQKRLDTDLRWVDRINENGRKYGVYADYKYYGVGDQGGACRERDVKVCVESLNNPDSQIKVALVSSDQMYRDITAEQKDKLPSYQGDLL
jgi:alpha-mannosidase